MGVCGRRQNRPKAIVSDTHDEVLSVHGFTFADDTVTSEPMENNDAHRGAEVSISFLDLTEIRDLFAKIEACYDCDVPEAVYYLRKAKSALNAAKKAI